MEYHCPKHLLVPHDFFYTQLHENVCCLSENTTPLVITTHGPEVRENKNSYYKILTEIFHLLFFSTIFFSLINKISRLNDHMALTYNYREILTNREFVKVENT